MTVQDVVSELVDLGPLPPEGGADIQDVALRQGLLERIEAPISDEDAHLLIMAFGSDTCFGLAWTILHLVESAPSARIADYSHNSDNEWVKLLEQRRRRAEHGDEAGT